MITKQKNNSYWLTRAQYNTKKNAGTLIDGAEYNIIGIEGENELISNKVYSISSSSSDTQYPSAKAVYNVTSLLVSARVENHKLILSSQVAYDDGEEISY